MSIQKSLRLSLVLMACLPLIFLTIFTYNLSYKKYMDLATQSTVELAKNYGMGFQSQLNSQIAEVEGLANGTNIQNLVLENYNGVTLGNDSPYYTNVTDLFATASDYAGNNVNYYLYDVNGYYITSSDNTNTDDWQEHMAIPVEDITETKILQCSPLDEIESIDVVSPIIIKSQIVGLIRANITSRYFGSFIPEDGSAFIMTNDGGYLFTSTGLTGQRELETQAFNCLNGADNAKDYGHLKASSFKNIYGFCKLSDSNWLYLIKQQGTQYQQILATLPITMSITLIIILMIAIWVSRILSAKYTEPIFTLRDNMTDASSGNLDVKCDVASDDEFGDLSRMFNSMMDIISNNYKELSASKAALEVSEQELKKNYAHIEQLAYHDDLTGLYNRVAFMKYAYKIFHDASVGASKHAIFFIDLDNFKNINDTLGHDYGDLLLKDVSDRMLSCIASDDILARNGGDEFLILKNRFDTVDDLENFASQLVNVVHHPFILNDETAVVSMSVGIAVFPNNGLTVSELIKNADIAMYNAKNSGKNSYRFFDSYMEDDVNRKNDLADILSHVIDKNEIYLQYQPQVNVESGQVTGYEALMRIESELVGFISPAEFIPIAEETGIINILGEWALIEACNFNQVLIKSGFGPLRVSVNVSTTQLKDDHLIDIIKSIPEKTGMDLKHLEIEITESVLMNSFEHNLKLINQMKELGCSIALDDFGTGYSSFNYLTQIPIDTLKIDKSFIDGICSNEKDRCIADSIIDLAHKMDISVVAEGVEDNEQLQILQNQFCDTLQGYLFSKPLNSTDFIELLSKHKTLHD
ncbi:EAL domain-containing protein [Wujia sp.]|uniref:bifunctional diguanylate cyclase/phosphodiesterase n=1 Tax=Wujia sp. TaxID=2944172 RepID=UPI003F7E48F6